MCSNKKTIPLRPHHGMCLAYFQGKGYSSEFTRHMAEVQKCLKAGAEVRLTVGADAVCSACPNLQNGICVSTDIVEAYDRGVLTMCGLSEGAQMPFSEFSAQVQEKILTPGRRREICGKCQWNELCE